MAAILDIVVPVYRGEAETRACLASLLASRNEHPAHVIVVDDASPEPAITEHLRALAAQGRIELIRHDANRGFVASVNEALARHPERDVVLLNSDTEVAPGWLDRLAAHAAREARVATVTPFSNNATILSYPRPLVPNPLPEGETTPSLDAAFAAANAARSVDIPTAVGFCMFVSRRCLDEVGAFDESRYGLGYGEEVDFCMRAGRAGFRHLAAGDVFVRHVGEVSFGAAGVERRTQAQATVDALYPEFQVRLAAFLGGDPLAQLRRRVDLERLRRSPRRRVLLLGRPASPDAAAPDREKLRLERVAGSGLRLRWARPGEAYAEDFRGLGGWARLLGRLARLGVRRIARA